MNGVPRRIRVGVLMGGASSERDISLLSGKMIADNLPKDRYDVVMLDTLALMAHNARIAPALQLRAQALVTGRRSLAGAAPGDQALTAEFRDQAQKAGEAVAPATDALSIDNRESPIDVAFLALHGPYGEDGTLQGMLDLIGMPYVGSGCLASALAMDKAMAKKVFAADGIATPRGVVVARAAFLDDPVGAVSEAAKLVPAVVKPSRQGSSIGMTMVNHMAGLEPALTTAFGFDDVVLVEERLRGTEITVGVLGNRELQALPVVEILPKRDFFDYKAKYDPALTDEICPAHLPPEVAAEAQSLALRAHRSLGCRGLSRTDMIVTRDRGIVVLEVNTMPGMTRNSLLPKAAAAAGIAFPELLDRLVHLALDPDQQV